MTDELKPCPFCGGKATCVEFYGEYHVLCCDCHAAGQDCSTRDQAVSAWNARPIEEDLDKKNGCLIGTCHDLHDIVEEFRAECGQKDLEIKRLREALESIKEMSSYMSADKITIYDLIDIHNICCDALESGEE